MPAIVTYNNSTIATVSSSATLKTKGTWSPYDIVVKDVAEDSYAIAFINRTINSIPSSVVTTVGIIGDYAFAYCSTLSTISFPNATIIGGHAFQNCYSLTTASFPNVTRIDNYAFNGCSKLSSLYLMRSSVAFLSGTDTFVNTPMSLSTYLGYFGSIYVPTSLLTAYQTATYWSVYSARIVGV